MWDSKGVENFRILYLITVDVKIQKTKHQRQVLTMLTWKKCAFEWSRERRKTPNDSKKTFLAMRVSLRRKIINYFTDIYFSMVFVGACLWLKPRIAESLACVWENLNIAKARTKTLSATGFSFIFQALAHLSTLLLLFLQFMYCLFIMLINICIYRQFFQLQFPPIRLDEISSYLPMWRWCVYVYVIMNF